MTIAITDVVRMSQEYQGFQNAYTVTGQALQEVINTGTVLYNDASLAQQFPNSIAAYQAYLLSLQTYINTFLGGLPQAPPLNG